MPLLNRAIAMQSEIARWRRELHRNPELLYDTQRTAGFVAEKLRRLGCDDAAIPYGVSYWVTLAETLLQPKDN
jgi:hippurate hydrolase